MKIYSECPIEIISIAQQLINNFHPILKDCKIGFVMVNEASTSGGKTVVAKVSKVPDKLRPYIPEELDMLVIISEDEWLHFGVEGRKAIIDHELCHIVFSSSGGFTTKAHDIEEFQEIIERYGYWNSDLRNARDAFISATQLKLPVTDNNPKGVLVQVKSFGLADR